VSRLLLIAILTLFVVCAPPSSRLDARAQAPRPAAAQVQAVAPLKSTLPNDPDSVKFLVIGDSGTGDRFQYDVAAKIVDARVRFPFEFAIMLGDNLYGSEKAADYVRKFEVPYGPLPGVVEAVTEAVAGSHRYPDLGVVALRDKLAERLGVAADRIATGCGSVALAEHLAKVTCRDGDEIIFAWRSFEAYPIIAAVAGATAVRVPVRIGHCAHVSAVFERPVPPDEARSLWASFPGLKVIDDPAHGRFPTALDADGIDDVLVGRARTSLVNPRGLLFLCASDNLRKGAATNAVQIAQALDELAVRVARRAR